jgi:hypothetical protein
MPLSYELLSKQLLKFKAAKLVNYKLLTKHLTQEVDKWFNFAIFAP